MQKRPIKNARIWITGATSGIGNALAIAFAKRQNQVIISGRNEDILDKMVATYPECMIKLKMDVTNREEVMAGAKFIDNLWGALDIAILNAGISDFMQTDHFDSRMLERIFNVNVIGLAHTVEAALPLLRQGVHPYLLGMSSAAGFGPLPTAEAYGASKAAVHYMMMSLRSDLYAEKIDVSVICPGFVKTPMTAKNKFWMPHLISASKAADLIIQGMEKRQVEIHFPKCFTYIVKFYALWPEWLKVRLSQLFLKRFK